MIEGKSIFRTYHELELEIDAWEIRLAGLLKEREILRYKGEPKIPDGVSFDRILVIGAGPYMSDFEQTRLLADVLDKITECEQILYAKKSAFEDLKKRIRQTKNKLESDTTLNVFVVRVIEGKSPQEASRTLAYELPTIFNAMVEINKYMGVSAL